MKVAIIQFPGSNCDWDAEHSVEDVIGLPAGRVWHKDSLPDGTGGSHRAWRIFIRRLS